VGAVAELKQKYGCRVVAPHDKTTAIADVDLRVGHGDVIKVGELLARVLETPGHTLDHVSYVFDADKAVFAADTLFSVGCGRVFEGTYPMMRDSLLRLRALPDDFRLYCGHEYTASNVKFALTVDGDNEALKARAAEVTRLRAANESTIPSLLGDEKQTNVFLRAVDPAVAIKLRMKGATAEQVFSELRERKNKS
ncbi:MAG: hydroxyacylglutathione hydrolase, partial [Bradyrhizobium sp.]|nr:hydroxyacylglutathione hydrolase [Bradyrhizobium sp.]